MGCGAPSTTRNANAEPELTKSNIDDFEQPFQPMGKSGGTAAFFHARYKPGATELEAQKSIEYWIAKDVARSKDELTFYETAMALLRTSSHVPCWDILSWMIPYRGTCEAPCICRQGDPPKNANVMMIKNCRAGYRKCRMLDIKVGPVTAVAGWQGKGHLSAWGQSWLDWATSSAGRGSRLEGFDNPPLTLRILEQLAARGPSSEKKLKRFHLQRMLASEYLRFFSDLQDCTALDTVGTDQLCKVELQELVLLRCIEELAGFLAACRKVPVPQQWIGSSIMLSFDCETMPNRADVLGGGPGVQDLVRVHIFDWGRSVLNTEEINQKLSEGEQAERRKYWNYYREGVGKLFYDCCSLYVGRYWYPSRSLAFTVWDEDTYSSEDFIGCAIVPLEKAGNGGLPKSVGLMEKGGETLKSGIMSPKDALLLFTVTEQTLSPQSRLDGRFAIKIHSAKDLPKMDMLSQSDAVAQVSGIPHDSVALQRLWQDEVLDPKNIRDTAHFTKLKQDTASPVWDEEFEIAHLNEEARRPFIAALTTALGREHDIPCTETDVRSIFPPTFELDATRRTQLEATFVQQVSQLTTPEIRRSATSCDLTDFPENDRLRLLHFGRWLQTEGKTDSVVYLLFLLAGTKLDLAEWSALRFSKAFLRIGQSKPWAVELGQAVRALEGQPDETAGESASSEILHRCKAFLKQIAMLELRHDWNTYDWQNQDEEYCYFVGAPTSPPGVEPADEAAYSNGLQVVACIRDRSMEHDHEANSDGVDAAVPQQPVQEPISFSAPDTGPQNPTEAIIHAMPLFIQAMTRSNAEEDALMTAVTHILGPDPLSNPSRVANVRYFIPAGGCRLVPSPGDNDFVFDSIGQNLLGPMRRDVAGIDDEALMSELGHPGRAPTSFSTNSKSGEVFLVSKNGRFIIKSITDNEAQALIDIMLQYVEHVRAPEGSMLGLYIGLYRFDIGFGQGLRYITIMQSVFDGHRGCFDVVYDLKGATHKRWAKDKESVRKDVDWLNDGRCLRLCPADKECLRKIHVRDSEFLRSCNVMDYSMLVGIGQLDGTGALPKMTRAWKSESGQECYFLGIIDFLVEFGITMRMYHLVKHQMTGRAAESSVTDPESYATRQQDFFATKMLQVCLE